MDMFLITKILDLTYAQNYMRCLSQNKSDSKLFRVYLFTVASLAPLGLLIVKTVTNILELLRNLNHKSQLLLFLSICLYN